MATRSLLALAHKTLGHAAGLLASLGVFTAVDFSHTITLGSVLLAFIVIAISGIFTVRSKIASIWKQEAEGERAAKLRAESTLTAERESRAAFERQQQELRHDLKGEIAALKAQLKAMEAKTDLTAALEAIRQLNQQTTAGIVDAMHKTSLLSENRDSQTHKLLEEIRDKLPSEPIAVHEISPPEPA